MGKKGCLIVVAVLCIPTVFFAWEWFLSPRAQVEHTLKAAAAAAERADSAALLSFISKDYSDFLHPSRAAFGERLREVFDRVDRLNVTLENVRIEVLEDEAMARLDLVVVAIRGQERYVGLGSPFDPERVTVRLAREDGWKITGVERSLTPGQDLER